MGRTLALFFAIFLLFAMPLPATQDDSKPRAESTNVAVPETARERTLLAEKFAVERLNVWQRLLNLQDWNVSLFVVRADELKPKTLGNISWDTAKKTAAIRILDPADYKLPFSELLLDLEYTVVHELIHLQLSPVLSPLQRNDANRREEEHAVNYMTDALLKLDRKNRALAQAPQQTTASQTGGENGNASRSK